MSWLQLDRWEGGETTLTPWSWGCSVESPIVTIGHCRVEIFLKKILVLYNCNFILKYHIEYFLFFFMFYIPERSWVSSSRMSCLALLGLSTAALPRPAWSTVATGQGWVDLRWPAAGLTLDTDREPECPGLVWLPHPQLVISRCLIWTWLLNNTHIHNVPGDSP